MRFLVLLLIGVLVGCAEKTLEQRTESGDTQFNLGAMYQMGNGSLKAGFGEWEQVLQVLDLFGCTAIPCLVLFFIFIPFMEVIRRDWEKGLNRAWLVFAIVWWVGGCSYGGVSHGWWHDEFFPPVFTLILTPLFVAGLWRICGWIIIEFKEDVPVVEVIRRNWKNGLNRAWLVFSIIWWVGGFGAGRWYDEFQSVSLLEFLSLWILTPLAVAGLWKTWVDGYARMGDKDV